MKTLGLAVLLLLAGTVCRADQVYQVNGSLSVAGNNACSGTCTETLDFSFQLDESFQTSQNGYYLSIVPGSSSVSSTGPLGVFASPIGPETQVPHGGPDADYLEFDSPAFSTVTPSDQIDLWLKQSALSSPFTPQIGGVDLFSCATTVCLNDFCAPGNGDDPSCAANQPLYLFGQVEGTVTPVSTPEPSTSLLLGALALALIAVKAGISRMRDPVGRRT